MFRKKRKKIGDLDLLRAYQAVEERLEDWAGEVSGRKRKKERAFLFGMLRTVFYGFLGGVLIVVIAGGFILKDVWRTWESAMAGKEHLEECMAHLYDRNFGAVSVSAFGANIRLKEAYKGVEEIEDNFFISRIDHLRENVDATKHLLRSGILVAASAESGAATAKDLTGLSPGGGVNFKDLPPEKKEEFLRTLYESSSEFRGVKGNLQLAALEMEQIKRRNIPFLNEILTKIEEKLERGEAIMDIAIDVSELVPPLAGYPDRTTFLLLLQNSDELRPTGGFLGTYGIAQTKNGEFARLDTHDIYHMDMPIEDLDLLDVEPPSPIKEHLNKKWFMRDSNWSPDWPSAAQKIEWFYHRENELLPSENRINDFSREFDGVVGITPGFVTGLLALTGPVEIEGTEYNKDNFTRLLQYRVEKGYVQKGVPAWKRKEVIGEILQELKIKLLDLSLDRWEEVANILKRNIERKNVMLYTKDEYLQERLEEKNMAGHIRDVEGDYLMVVDANLGARKTDRVIRRNINYQIDGGVNGLFVQVDINYSHSGEIDWRTSDYKTYTRIYVPRGSELISFDKTNDAAPVETFPSTDTEFGKTVFGTYIIIPAGENGSISLRYKLPSRLEERLKRKGYDLYWQKQPGNDIEKITVDAELGHRVKSYNPIGFYSDKVGEGHVRWSGELQGDRKFEIRTER